MMSKYYDWSLERKLDFLKAMLEPGLRASQSLSQKSKGELVEKQMSVKATDEFPELRSWMRDRLGCDPMGTTHEE